MLPDLSSSYKRYKDDTNAFTTWLGRAAETCGYKPPVPKSKSTPPEAPVPNPTSKLKGKAENAPTPTKARVEPEHSSGEGKPGHVKKYAVTTQEILQQIHVVSQSSIRLPSGVKSMLERAIQARETFTKWYDDMAKGSSRLGTADNNNSGHRHFTRVLEEALSNLTAESVGAPAHGTAKMGPQHQDMHNTQNRFSSLTVEDILDEPCAPSPAERAPATRPATNKKDEELYVFIPLADVWDYCFAIYCFYRDLHHIQDSIRRLWSKCFIGTTSLPVAAAVTQIAISKIHRAEEGLISYLMDMTSNNIDTSDTYLALLSFLMMPSHIGGSVKSVQSALNESLINGFVYFPTYGILSKYADTGARSVKQPPLVWPPPIMPMFPDYSNKPENGNDPRVSRLRKDDLLLSQLLLELQLPDQFTNMANTAPENSKHDKSTDEILKNLRAPIKEDIFWKTMRPLWLTGTLTTTMVFTAQIMLDIHHICGTKVDRFQGPLQDLHKHAQGSYDFKNVYGRAFSTGATQWYRKDQTPVNDAFSAITRIGNPPLSLLKDITRKLQSNCGVDVSYTATASSSIPAGLTEDEKAKCQTELRTMGQKLSSQFIQPASADNFAATHNPLYAGGAMLNLLQLNNETGIALENHHKSIFAAAHLYNALRQLNLLDTPWPIMDRVIQIHQKALFANAIPTRTTDMYDRIAYRLNVWKQCRYSPGDTRNDFKHPDHARIVRLMLAEKGSDYHKALWHFEKHLDFVGNQANTTTASSTHPSSSSHRKSLQEFFNCAEDSFASMLDELAIDYIRLVKHSILLLQTFRNMWRIEAQHVQGHLLDEELFKPIRQEDGGVDQGLLAIVTGALSEAKHLREKGIFSYAAGDGDDHAHTGTLFCTKHINHPARHGHGLKTAAKVFKAFLAKDKGDFMVHYNMNVSIAEVLGPVQYSITDTDYKILRNAYPEFSIWIRRKHSACQLHRALLKDKDNIGPVKRIIGMLIRSQPKAGEETSFVLTALRKPYFEIQTQEEEGGSAETVLELLKEFNAQAQKVANQDVLQPDCPYCPVRGKS